MKLHGSQGRPLDEVYVGLTQAEARELRDAVNQLAGKLTDAEMRRLNYAVDGDKRDVKEVVREFLARQ